MAPTAGRLLALRRLPTLLRTLIALPLLPSGSVGDLGLPQLGLVFIIGQLGRVHGVMRTGLSGGGRGQQWLLLGEASGVVPVLRVLLLLFLILEEVLDLVGHVQEVLLGNLTALQTLAGLRSNSETTTFRPTTRRTFKKLQAAELNVKLFPL